MVTGQEVGEPTWVPAQIQGTSIRGDYGGRGPRVLLGGQSFNDQPGPRVAPWNQHDLLDLDPHGGLVWFGDSRQTPQGTQLREPILQLFAVGTHHCPAALTGLGGRNGAGMSLWLPPAA